MRYVRPAVIALAAAAVIAATATPAAAATVTAECGGTAPLQTTCSTTGSLYETSGNFYQWCSGVLAGTIHFTMTTSTASTSFDCIPVADQGNTVNNRVDTGTYYNGQAFTLTGEASGAGTWSVSVAEE